jgi:spermidine/putrescine transport system ATP-binding protein
MSPKRVTADGLTKRYGETTAVEDLSLSVEAGELFCLLGPSGCGKTTTLRMVAGLDEPSGGAVHIGDREVTGVPAADRDSSIVFQDWALFPHRTALENVAFGLKMAGVGKAERRERAREQLATVDMTEEADSRPDELSGGQKQRVALARSLAVDPAVLLLDEPLSNLDKRLRQRMQLELKEIHERVGTTMVHVTHDQDEAFTLGDRIGIMRDGDLVQVGDPHEVYDDPDSLFVEEFLGEVTAVRGTVSGSTAETPLGTVALPGPADGPVTATLRPEAIDLRRRATQPPAGPSDAAQADGDGTRAVEGRVSDVLYRGSTVRYYVEADGVEPFAEFSTRTDPGLDRGDRVAVRFNPDDLRLFDATGERLR